MKDQADIKTTDLFNEPKKRGRPATGKAKTAAQRQAAYRRNKHVSGKLGGVNLNTWIDLSALGALERLMNKNNMTKSEMLEKLIFEAEEKIRKTLKTEEEINDFFKYRNT